MEQPLLGQAPAPTTKEVNLGIKVKLDIVGQPYLKLKEENDDTNNY